MSCDDYIFILCKKASKQKPNEQTKRKQNTIVSQLQQECEMQSDQPKREGTSLKSRVEKEGINKIINKLL